jgi:hypothetical protein
MAVGIDAPCRWGATGRARVAERELMKEKLWCFSTPTAEKAISHPKNYYGWMLAGAEAFKAMERTHRLYAGQLTGDRVCFETFPHAVSCAMSGKHVAAP